MSGRRGARIALAAVGLAITAGCMYFAVRGVELEDALAALRAADARWLVPTLAVFAGAVALRALRWWAVFAPARRPPLGALAAALMIGYLFNNILPARAGEAVRVIALHRRAAATPRAETIATVVAERLFDLVALLAILLCSYPWLPEISWLRAAAVVGAIVVAGVVALAWVVVRYEERALHWLLAPLRRVRRANVAERAEHAAVNATRGLAALRDPGIALRGMALTVASWVVLAVSYWLLMAGFDLQLPLSAALLVVVAINLSLVLPSSPAALGVFEAATVIALAAFDVPRAEALSYAIVLHVINVVPFVIVGGALLAPEALRRRR